MSSMRDASDRTRLVPAPKPKLVPPTGPPVPELVEHGFWGSIDDFADRVTQITVAHERARGFRPKPEQVFRAALAPNFSASALTDSVDRRPPPAAPSDDDIVKGLRAAAGQNFEAYQAYFRQHGDAIRRLQRNKRYGDRVNAIVNREMNTRLAARGEQVRAASLAEPPKILGVAAYQIADALIHSPQGLFEAAKTLGGDVSKAQLALAEKVTGREAAGEEDLTFKGTRQMGEAMGRGIYEDFRHPLRNPGYLFLDILGIASLGAGTAARVGAASKAPKGAKMKTLAAKPPLRRAEVRIGDYTEEALLSSNPLVAAAQKMVLGYRQGQADKRLDGGTESLASVMLPGQAAEFMDATLSFERKVGREAEARMRTEHTATQALAHELDAVAGRALTQSRVFGRIPTTLRNGLSRGEQKAIQAHSWDIEGDIYRKIAAERDFHRRMIEAGVGSKKAHERQIADLTLAEKALENPRPQFEKALALTREVVAESEWRRIGDLGLLPTTAEGRVAKAGQVLRGEEPVGGQKVGGPESFYLPTQPRGEVKRPPSQGRGFFGVSAGPFGVPPGRAMPELTHEFTGRAMQAGDYRIDATSLATEAYARTARAVTVRNQHQKLWNAATATRQHDGQIPIRDVNEISDDLREVIAKLDEGEFTDADAALLPQDQADLIRALYPDEAKLTPDEIKHVRWIDGRLVSDQLGGGIPRWLGQTQAAANIVNEPFRFLALYARPAYLLNKLGNQAMLVLDQGFLNSIENLSRAHAAEKLYGQKNASTIRALVGQGRSRSYVTSKAGRLSRGAAEFWSRWTDRNERVASWLYYADRKGYKTPEDVNRLLTDKAAKADLSEVTRRANKALVEFDNLTAFEKNVLRHLIFVYPWVRGASVWSLRTIMEHPAKTAVLAQLGKQAIEGDPILDRAPEWYRRIGYIPLNWNGDGTPKVINPTSVNTFSTIGEMLNIGAAGTVGDRYASASEVFGPAAELFVRASTGRDEYGNEYEGSQIAGALKDVFETLPQLAAFREKKNEPLKKFDITKRDSLEARLNSALEQTVFSPGWLNGYGSMLAGGFSPRDVNLSALAARYWADQDPDVRHKREVDLLGRALAIQGKLVGREPPAGVRAAVKRQSDLTYRWQKFQKEHGRNPTEREKADITISSLPIPDSARAKLRAEVKTIAPEDLTAFRQKIMREHGGGKELREWDQAVRLVHSFRKDTFNRAAQSLFDQGLSTQRTYNLPQEKLTEYGRKYLAFTEEARSVNEQRRAGTATIDDLRLLEDENSRPRDGLPSFAALAWQHSHDTPVKQAAARARLKTKGWGTLTTTEKQALGYRDTKPGVFEAWRAYRALTTKEALAKQLPVGERSLDKEQRLAVVKQIDKHYGLKGAFLRDYLFDQAPLYKRLPYLDLVAKSSNKPRWDELFEQADTIAKAVTDERVTSRVAGDAWDDYVAQLPEYYRTERPAFWRELEPLLRANPDFLKGLID